MIDPADAQPGIEALALAIAARGEAIVDEAASVSPGGFSEYSVRGALLARLGREVNALATALEILAAT